MNDAQIRPILKAFLVDALLVDELTLPETRIDVAQIGEEFISGYEIKGKGDSTRLLKHQVALYNGVCGRAFLVCHPKHLNKVEELIPTWWGVFSVEEADRPHLLALRPAKENPMLSSRALLSLLWCDELRVKGRLLELAPKVVRSPGDKLRDVLSQQLSADEASRYVCNCLRERGDWREKRRQQESQAARLRAWRDGVGAEGARRFWGRSGFPPDEWEPPLQ